MTIPTPVIYLFASHTGKPDQSCATVFHKVNGEALAESLCSLFTREYPDANGCPAFHHKPATSLSAEEQVLLDESLDWLAIYDDPDPGIYDPQPSNETLVLAQYAARAQKWEELLRKRSEASNRNSVLDSSGAANQESPPIADLPEMSAEDRRNSTLILLMLLAQAYYRMLESAISMASWVTAVDLELNQSYLWTVTNITNLLKHAEDLKDFPAAFEPLFPDLYPSTIRDVEWEDMVAPDAERFLSTVQQYIHSKGTFEPEEGSLGWIFIEMFRPGVKTAIERASAYNKRIRQHLQRVLGSSAQAPPDVSAGVPPASTAASEPTAKNNNHGTKPIMPTTKRNKVFVSYSHKDKKLFEEFKTMLAPTIRDGIVDLWEDTKIKPGAKWKHEIQAALGSAKVAVLLVSQHFLASDFIAKHELPPLLKAAQADGVTVFWIYFSSCLYDQTEIATYQAAHDVSKPLDRLDKPHRQAVLNEICGKLVRLAQNP